MLGPVVGRGALQGGRGQQSLALAFIVFSVAVLLAGSGVSPSVARAAPRDETMARATEVKKQVDALDKQTAILIDEHNDARFRHAELAEQAKAAAKRLKATTKRTDAMQERLGSRAASMYRNGRMGLMEVLLGASDFQAFVQTWDFLRKLNEEDARAVTELKTAKAEQTAARRSLERRTEQAANVSHALAARRQAIESKLADRKRMLSGLEAQVAALDREEEARRAAEARRAIEAARVLRSASIPVEQPLPPPTNAARSDVVEIATRYLGAPYVWGAEGPSAFDCSGFTMFVYRQVGVQLPRVSRDQIHAGQPVSRADMQPGDLVFFGSPIHHVGIYVGDGMMIHSPRTGDVVKISPLHSDLVGAARP